MSRMRLLILGGAWFLGRTLASDALARGWQVTAFSRGRSGQPPAGVRHIVGDRTNETDVRRLAASGPWDAVVDTSAYEPIDVALVTNALAEQMRQYVLVSTVSVYQDWPDSAVTESARLFPSSPTYTETASELAGMTIGERYGTLKAGCEVAAADAACTLVVRPGVILGPGEYVGRGLKLLERAARGGRWLLPAPSDQPIQPVDVRDVSAFLLNAIESQLNGAYNLVAPEGHATYGDLVDVCLSLTGNRAQPTWVDPHWLAEQGVRQWTEIPLWRIPAGTWRVNGHKAANAGLACRPMTITLQDFKQSLDRDGLIEHPRQAQLGMAPQREAELLAKWDELQVSDARQR